MKKSNHILLEIQKLDRSIPTADEQTEAEYLCADGKAQIDICLLDDTQVFNPLTYGKQRDLAEDIYALIETKLYTIPLKYPIRVCFHGNIPDSHTQKEIRAVIREHYLYDLRDKKEDLRINLVKATCLAVLGIAVLAVYFALEFTTSNPLFMELLSITGCFSIWEAADTWILERKALKIEYWNAGQAALSDVRFQDK